MNKSELVSKVALEAAVSRATVEKVLETTAVVVAKEINTGSPVLLPGIGRLKKSVRAARMGRNPRTGQQVMHAAKAQVKLSTMASFKAHLTTD